MVTPARVVFLLTCLLSGRTAMSPPLESSSSDHRESVFISARVGGIVTLQCFYDGTAIFYWYKQTLGQRPRLLSEFFKHGSEGSFTNDFKNDPRFLLEIGDTKNHLTISNAQTSDSGTYYCVGGHSYVSEFYECYSVLVEDSSSYIQTSVDQSVLVVFLLFLLWKINKRNNCTSTGTQTSFTAENKDTENLHYAAINVKRSNRSRQKNDLNTDCVYASVRQQN
uniref:Immunoglobulin kappa light chain-like n=1 Tax=Oryzias melastigma TaxID=30732 RepID=A0A3B3CG85_ORYME